MQQELEKYIGRKAIEDNQLKITDSIKIGRKLKQCQAR